MIINIVYCGCQTDSVCNFNCHTTHFCQPLELQRFVCVSLWGQRVSVSKAEVGQTGKADVAGSQDVDNSFEDNSIMIDMQAVTHFSGD